MHFRALWVVCFAFGLIACGDSSSNDDASTTTDAAVPDQGFGPEAGPLDNDEPFAPTKFCPGPGCLDEGDDVLRVGAGKFEYTPVIDENTEIQLTDVNGNHLYDPGDEFRDVNNNGEFDGIWIAGYSIGRSASGVLTPQWARAIVLERNGIRIALVSIDCVGFFRDEIAAAREVIAERGLDIDYVSVSSTHDHGARDTVGIWGRDIATSGKDPAYNAAIRNAIVESVAQAVGALAPAHIQYASTNLRDHEGGTARYIGDARDPFIVDDELRVIRFFSATDETNTIATLINVGAHAEYSGGDSQNITSDYPHFIREVVENGTTLGGEPIVGLGGIAVFYQGALGVQIGPRRTHPLDFDATELPIRSERTAEVLGTKLGRIALETLANGAVSDETAALGFRNHEFYVQVQNRLYQIAFALELMTRKAYFYDETRAINPETNVPWILTEIAMIDIGRARILAVPGELDPSLFVGGYDGSYTPAGETLIDTAAAHAPDLSQAPAGPYLRELMGSEHEFRLVFGLAEDFLGYFIPAYDYVLHPDAPYIVQAEGAHYEETNSIGIDGWPRIEAKIRALLAWNAP